ncbi:MULTISPECIES: ribokinase [unclassified Lentimicrobium]|uniref:ribokinase n=1 Tax=unclassified Lentimicrobium TaxID=2677434 RepID=UPI0015570783|nr:MULTISPECIES: ribokinase [unclassified Lentimicrobium]NPD47520.1 ribokinase [Lentimicrobium sp. S6]NPD84669.1 ribokinase [Lentimicrobium sp. L6]
MGKIVVIGSINTDMVACAPNLPVPGESRLATSFNIHFGGKGANQAVAAARAGGKVSLIAKVGHDDFGREAIENYKKDQISTDYIFVDEKEPSGVALIMVGDVSGQNSIMVAPGANHKLSIEDIKKAEDVIAKADVVLVQLEIPMETVLFSLQMAKKHGVTTILNPGPAKYLNEEIWANVDYITPNESETHFLVGVNPKTDATIKKASTMLLEKVNKGVILTLGQRGAYYSSKEGKSILVPSIRVSAVDSTAAGDVFNGYLAQGISEGLWVRNSIIIANKAATISVTRKGAQSSIPYKEELK